MREGEKGSAGEERARERERVSIETRGRAKGSAKRWEVITEERWGTFRKKDDFIEGSQNDSRRISVVNGTKNVTNWYQNVTK